MRISDWSSDVCSSDLRHVDEHVGMILGDDAIHREGEWIGVRELIECRQHTVGKILVITHYARDRSNLRRCLHARAKEAIRAVANFVPVDGWYAAPPKEYFGVGELHQLLRKDEGEIGRAAGREGGGED